MGLYIIDGIAAIVIPMAALMVMLGIACAASYLINLYNGDAELPKWHRKSPRKGGASRGQVGEKIRRRNECSYIVAQPGGDVKVSWVYYRR
jgi:hypothetical protein